MESPENIFVELVELEDQSSQGIVEQLLRALKDVNFTKDFLSKTLIGLVRWRISYARPQVWSDSQNVIHFSLI